MTILQNSETRTVVHFTANDELVITGGNDAGLSANLTGTVTVNATSTTIEGSGTAFDTDFTQGDYVAVWSNSTNYEVRQIATITDSDTMDIEASPLFTIDDAGLNHAFAVPASNLTSNTSEVILGGTISQVWHGCDNDGAWIVKRGNTTVNSVVGIFANTGHEQYAQHGSVLNLNADKQSLYVTLNGSANGYIMFDLRKESVF